MRDAWTYTIALMNRAYRAPRVRWPPARTLRIVAHDDDESLAAYGAADSSLLPPLPRRATDDEIVAALELTGRSISTAQLARAMQVHRQTAWEKLRRIAAGGRLRHEGGAWRT